MKLDLQMIDEYIKCRDSIKYFAEKYIKINHPTHGEMSIILNEFQIRAVNRFEAGERIFVETVKRQFGKSTIASIIILHNSIFNEYKTAAIFSYKRAASDDMLRRIEDMYMSLPELFKTVKITKRNKSIIEFNNGSKITSVGSNPQHCRGMNLSTIYIDESDFVKTIDEILKCLVPVISSSQKSCIFSFTTSRTACLFEDNYFYV